MQDPQYQSAATQVGDGLSGQTRITQFREFIVALFSGGNAISPSNPIPVMSVIETISLDTTTVSGGAGAGNYLVEQADNTVGEQSFFSPTNYGADAGATDSYAVTLDPAPAAYVEGQQYMFKANTANTGAASLNINGLGAKTIVKAVSTTLANNDILAGMFCLVVYDGTNFVLLNPRAL